MSVFPFRLALFFRKRYPTAFSIERVFEQLATAFAARGVQLTCHELPHYNNELGKVKQNVKWARTQVQSLFGNPTIIAHVTGDVNSIVFGLRCPTVITIHDCNPLLRYARWHPRYWFYRWVIFEWPARRASAVTVISEKTRTELISLTKCPADKIHVIPNFIDPAFTYSAADFRSDYPTILQIGVKENKNLARLAEALRDLPCRLLIVGQPSPEDQDVLRENRIDFHWEAGLSDDQVRQRYADCDLLSFVSTYEGFGLPILEAQATGRPVLTSNISPHRDIAGEGGAVLVDPYSVASIREGVESIINHEALRNELTSRGRTNADLYGIEAVARQYLDLYAKIL